MGLRRPAYSCDGSSPCSLVIISTLPTARKTECHLFNLASRAGVYICLWLSLRPCWICRWCSMEISTWKTLNERSSYRLDWHQQCIPGSEELWPLVLQAIIFFHNGSSLHQLNNPVPLHHFAPFLLFELALPPQVVKCFHKTVCHSGHQYTTGEWSFDFISLEFQALSSVIWHCCPAISNGSDELNLTRGGL